MNKPLFSIVIPTKNRYEYLKILLEALLDNSREDFEIIIQDNSDFSEELIGFQKFLLERNDERTIYEHKEGWLSVIDNCDLGVEKAKGDYVCMLGDDDGLLLERTLALVKHMKDNSIDAAWINMISYSWPDNTHATWGGSYSGNVSHKEFKYKIDKLNSKYELERILRKGAAYGLGNLPRVYHGIVSKKVLDEVKEDTGSFFPGPSPDMANAVGITRFIDNYIYADIPTIISGHCKKSTGGQGGRKEHHGKIENIGHLPKDTSTKWSPKVPFFWSGATIYAESARRALVETKRNDEINYPYLWATCLVYERNYSKEVLKAMRSSVNTHSSFVSKLKVLFYLSIIIFNRGLNYLGNVVKYRFKNDNLIQAKDISHAINILDDKLEKFKY